MPHFIKVRTSVIGYHRYRNAPANVAFLREYHRHVFGVTLTLEVNHADRQLEFFTVKDALDRLLREVYQGKEFEASCEAMAEFVCRHFGGVMCEVDEDGENSGVFVMPPEATTAAEQKVLLFDWLGVADGNAA